MNTSTAASFSPSSPPRLTFEGAVRERLFFAQVREDPLLELEALAPAMRGAVAVVSSGGCTALSLLAAGARVAAVDLNSTQNDTVELKVAALSRLCRADALAFLGATEAPPADRLRLYQEARGQLSPCARVQWDARAGDLRRGVLASGVTERFLAAVVAAVRALVHPRSRIEALLRCRTVEEQRALYHREWDSRRWRALFKVLINRATLNRAYDPAFFQHVENPSFAEHFYKQVEHSLCALPIRTNYFLHQMLTGVYPAPVEGGLPPYLTEEDARAVADRRSELTLVDAPFTAYLKTLPARSLSGISLSNICEWLTPQQVDELFAEIARTAAPDAVLCFRNFVGWTEVPERWRARIVEDRPRGEAMIARDRSAVQRRFAVCKVLAS